MKATKAETKSEPEPILCKKNIKHFFTAEERDKYQLELLAALQRRDTAQADFDSVKASYKAKITEANSQIIVLASMLRNGWEMRLEEVEVRLRPKDGKKDFYLVSKGAEAEVAESYLVLTEDMIAEDYEQELFDADKNFSKQKIVTLWEAGQDNGVVVLGSLNGKWYGAVRGNMGTKSIGERLDSMQPAFSMREDCFYNACARALKWIKQSIGRNSVKRFQDSIEKAILVEIGKSE